MRIHDRGDDRDADHHGIHRTVYTDPPVFSTGPEADSRGGELALAVRLRR